MAKVLPDNRINELINLLTSSDTAVFGPADRTEGQPSSFRQINSADQIDLQMILPRLSVKSLIFPRTEPILRFDIAKQAVDVAEIMPEDQKRIVFGTRPCDAASLAMLDKLFNWDYEDAYWNHRRENTTIVSVACTRKDDFCMCTSLGLAPDGTLGSDVLLKPTADAVGWQVEPLTDKGKGFVDGIAELLTEQDPIELAPIVEVEKKFDLTKAADWLSEAENFDSDLWAKLCERCIGCGVCTYLCPTCHCFDIQDEGNARTGVRRKNWDSCSFAQFTVHTSGHNPRPDQASRWRQRIMHKYNYYPSKFETHACTGCGRCTRHCPADMGVTETLQTIGSLTGCGLRIV